MNDKLTCNKYLVVRNFIPENRALDLGIEFGDHCRKENIPGDSQAPHSSSVYNYISFLELLCEKTPEISKIVGETVLPTYTYARVYRTGDELLRHKDRPSCELSLTVNLGGSEPWDIWVESEGKEIPITLNPGDAVVYLGAEIEHWREKFNGDHYYQVFLHYVLSRGQYAQHCFDRVESDTRKIIFPSKKEDSIIIESLEDIVEVTDNSKIETTDESPLVVGESPIETTDESPLVIGESPLTITDKKEDYTITELNEYKDKSSSKLEDYIHVFENVLSDELCDEIVNTFSDDSLLCPAAIKDENIVNYSRTCTTIPISVPQDQIPEDKRLYLDGELFNVVNNVMSMYTEIHPNVQVEIDTGYDFLKYAEGQYYTKHTDSFQKQQRTLSCSFQLNDDFEGGEFCFFDRDIKLSLKKGSALVFPSNFMYPHEILPITKNTRYSIITWLV